jgi:hypothetical protein
MVKVRGTETVEVSMSLRLRLSEKRCCLEIRLRLGDAGDIAPYLTLQVLFRRVALVDVPTQSLLAQFVVSLGGNAIDIVALARVAGTFDHIGVSTDNLDGLRFDVRILDRDAVVSFHIAFCF